MKKYLNIIDFIFNLFLIEEKEQSNIFVLGGVNIFLPLYEIAFKNFSYNQNDLNDQINLNLLNILKIINDNQENIKNALDTNFFSLVSIQINIVIFIELYFIYLNHKTLI